MEVSTKDGFKDENEEESSLVQTTTVYIPPPRPCLRPIRSHSY